MVQATAEACSDTPPDWQEGLPAAALEAILWLALDRPVLTLSSQGWLRRDGGDAAAAARHEATVLWRLSAVCRCWRAALSVALEQATWAVAVQRHSGVDLRRLEPLRVAALDLRALTWAEQGGGAACEALLRSPAFQARSAPHLRAVAGIPERLAGLLAASFPRLESVGLCGDYDSEGFGQHGGKGHLAPMALGPLRALRALRSLSLELGVADLAGLPPGLSSVTLMDVDRLVLPLVEGASVADRLLHVVAAAGLRRLTLQATSGCLVFEEPQKAPLELELSHAARLLAGRASGAHDPGWHLELGLCNDGWRRVPQLVLSRRQAAGEAGSGALG